MAQPAPHSEPLHAGLCRIDLPRMGIKDAGLVRRIDPIQISLRGPVGEEAKITTACTGNILPEQAAGGERELPKHSGARSERVPRCIGRAIEVMADGVKARTIGVALLLQDLVCPRRLGTNRKSGSAVPSFCRSGDVLDSAFCAANIFTKVVCG